MLIKQNIKLVETDILILPFFEEKKISFSSILKDIPELESYMTVLDSQNDFCGKKGEMLLFYTPAKHFSRVMLLGLGKKEDPSDTIRKMAGKARKKMNKFKIGKVQIFLKKDLEKPSFVQAFLEGFLLGGYRFHFFKTDKTEQETAVSLQEIHFYTPYLHTKIQENFHETESVCNANLYVRDLVNTPANELTPLKLAQEAKKISKKNKRIKFTLFKEKHLKKLGCNALLSVSQGSAHPPCMMVLEYRSKVKNAKTIALVGKGLTFDTGGIHLKPFAGLGNMKCDMAGGATVLGIFKILSENHELPVHLIGVVGASENAISDQATRPGDIVSSYAGKTIEITNTDAEGRLLLADTLAYTVDTWPVDLVIDIATLTGSCIMALGNSITGMITNSESFLRKMEKTAKATDEMIWRLPLTEEFMEKTKGDISDLKNFTPNMNGQTMMAGAFLSHFISNKPWVHFDIAGTAWTENDQEYISKGGTGIMIRFLWHFLKYEMGNS